MTPECGKIIFRMNTSSENRFEKPSIIQALISGFNTIANKPYLILLPIVLDLFLWFGPAWRVDAYFGPWIQNLSNLPGLNSTDYSEIIKETQALWHQILENFNLAFSLKTLPIGVPSLMASKPPFLNPLGHPITFSLKTGSQVIGIWFLFLLIGYFLGSLYFNNISEQVIKTPLENNRKTFLRTFSQVILMPLLLGIILILLSIPFLLLFAIVTMISPTISQFMLFMLGIIALWVLIPLVFTPHGIFLYKQNLIPAMMTSISVVRTSMAKSSWFVLLSALLIQGMNMLWQTPNVDNWFLFIGILGHAFIVTAVIAASFYYFIDATRFTQTVMNNKSKSD